METDHSNSSRCFPSRTKAGRRPRKRWRTGISERNGQTPRARTLGQAPAPSPCSVREKSEIPRPGGKDGSSELPPFLTKEARAHINGTCHSRRVPQASCSPETDAMVSIRQLRKRKLNEVKPCAPQGFAGETEPRSTSSKAQHLS